MSALRAAHGEAVAAEKARLFAALDAAYAAFEARKRELDADLLRAEATHRA